GDGGIAPGFTRGLLTELELTVADRHVDRRAWSEVTGEQPFGERIFQVTLDGALQRTGTELRIPTVLRQIVLRGRLELELQFALGELRLEQAQLDVDDAANLVPLEPAVHDYLIETIDEFGPELLTQCGHGGIVQLLVHARFIEVTALFDERELCGADVA